MDKVAIQSTSRRSAVCSDIIVRDGEQVRLVFRPEIVDNEQNPTAWEEFDAKPLSSLKKGEQFQLEIKSGELLRLLQELGALYRLHCVRGVPQGRIELIKIEQQLAKLLQLTEGELNEFLAANTNDAIKTLRRVLAWMSKSQSAIQQFADEDRQLPELNALLGLTNLRAILNVWRDNAANNNEEFWQTVFHKHAFVLSQLLAYPIVLIQGRAYVGGKRFDNAHGNLVDYLAKVQSSGAAVLIEIKTPQTPLLGATYRSDVFPHPEMLSERYLRFFNTANRSYRRCTRSFGIRIRA